MPVPIEVSRTSSQTVFSKCYSILKAMILREVVDARSGTKIYFEYTHVQGYYFALFIIAK